jgi:hypothetical protein
MEYGKNIPEMVALPDCPAELLTKVVREGKDDINSQWAVQQPNCPPEILTEVLRRYRNDEVSKYVLKNSKCPLKERNLWILKTTNTTNPDDISFIDYYLNSNDPNIKEDEEIREAVKDKLLIYIFDHYKPLGNIVAASLLNGKVKALLNEFQDDFEVSVVIDKINELRKENKQQ